MGDYEDSENFPDYAFRLEFINLEFFKIYLFNMDRLLEEEDKRVTQANKHILEGKERAFLQSEEAKANEAHYFTSSEIEMHHEINELTMNRISNEIFYPSFLISLYADFEKSLLKLCNELQSRNERLTVKDISGSGIQRSKTYLVKVLNVDQDFFGNTQEWAQILNYGNLRNHLVHDDRKIPYIKNGNLKFISEDDANLIPLHEESDINWISIDKEFCSVAINVIGNFWVSLLYEVSKIIEI